MKSKTLETTDDKTDLKILFLLFVLAVLVRAPRLFSLDVWFDEVAILLQTKMSFVEIWNFCKEENFPPLFPWIVKVWSLISTDDRWIRVLNLFIGSCIPPVMFLLGEETFDKKFGTILGIASVLSLPLVYFSQVIRMYSLFVLMAAISYYAFLLAIRTGKSKFWILLAIANVLGFYSFLFMIFVIIPEMIYLILEYKKWWKIKMRVVLTLLPSLLIISLWGLTLLRRYEIQQSYVPSHLLLRDPLMLVLYMGTGNNLNGNYLLASIINLPLMVGFIFSIPQWSKNTILTTLAFVFIFSVGAVTLLSIIGKSLFFYRYLSFLIPIYLILCLAGWRFTRTRRLTVLGTVLSLAVLLFSQVYYHLNFIQINDEYRYHGLYHSAMDEDGKSSSRIASFLSQNLQSDEVIVHYSTVVIRCLSFFPSIYFHQRSLPEYVYSLEDLPIHCGRQYQRPGERISSFNQIQPAPNGVWVVTWEDPYLSIYDSPQAVAKRLEKRTWRDYENLPKELYDAGFKPVRIVRSGSVSAVHFIRSETPDYEPLEVEVIRS
jgi:uncharacterized membrane protein